MKLVSNIFYSQYSELRYSFFHLHFYIICNEREGVLEPILDIGDVTVGATSLLQMLYWERKEMLIGA